MVPIDEDGNPTDDTPENNESDEGDTSNGDGQNTDDGSNEGDISDAQSASEFVQSGPEIAADFSVQHLDPSEDADSLEGTQDELLQQYWTANINAEEGASSANVSFQEKPTCKLAEKYFLADNKNELPHSSPRTKHEEAQNYEKQIQLMHEFMEMKGKIIRERNKRAPRIHPSPDVMRTAIVRKLLRSGDCSGCSPEQTLEKYVAEARKADVDPESELWTHAGAATEHEFGCTCPRCNINDGDSENSNCTCTECRTGLRNPHQLTGLPTEEEAAASATAEQ